MAKEVELKLLPQIFTEDREMEIHSNEYPLIRKNSGKVNSIITWKNLIVSTYSVQSPIKEPSTLYYMKII